MIKTLTIGDLHGKSVWNTINPDNYDKIIFIGDYVDCFTRTNEEIIDNLNNVIQFKKDNFDKVELLVGNHDVMYMLRSVNENNPYSCSGYRYSYHHILYDIFQKNKQLFKLAYQYKNYLWTHAGLHIGWWNADYPYSKKELKDVAIGLNKAFLEEQASIFQVGYSRGGFKSVGGPLWEDRRLTMSKPVKGLHQIIGHSKVNDIVTYDIDENTSTTFVDCLDTVTKFYELEI